MGRRSAVQDTDAVRREGSKRLESGWLRAGMVELEQLRYGEGGAKPAAKYAIGREKQEDVVFVHGRTSSRPFHTFLVRYAVKTWMP